MQFLNDPLVAARFSAGRELDIAATMLCERIAEVETPNSTSSNELLLLIAQYVVGRNGGKFLRAFEHLVGILRLLQNGGHTFPGIHAQLKTAAAYIAELPEDTTRPLPARW